jgi:hypothetical protein
MHMQFSQIQHCSVVVQDLDRAASFYRDVLGLTEIEIPSTFKPAGLNKSTSCKARKIRRTLNITWHYKWTMRNLRGYG